MPLWKKLVFSAATIALVFGLIELVLLAAGVRPLAVEEDPFVGFAANLPLYVAKPGAEDTPLMVTAENKRELFNMQQFPLHKPAGTLRIFCLGGSTTYGHPYDDRTSFAEGLRKLLPCADETRTWEVINAGGISYASYRVAALMQELVAYEPDLFIIYTGHNEFLEHRTYSNFLALPPLVRETSAALSHTRTYTVLRKLLSPETSGNHRREQLAAEVDAKLDHTVGPADYHRDEILRRQIVEHLLINLHRMVRIANGAGAQVIFVTPAANLRDCSPFKSEHRAGLSDVELNNWSAAYAAAHRHQENGEWQSAVDEYKAARAIDDRYAELHYRLGQCLMELAQPRAAGMAFVRARDEDVCPLRAPAEVIDAVRGVARSENVGLVDFQAIVGEWSRERFAGAAPGREMFLDHVHLSLDLTPRLAGLIVDEMVRCKILKNPPNQRCVADASREMAEQLTPAERGVGLRNIAKVYSWAGKIEEAGAAALDALQLLPNDRECLFIAGAHLKRIGRWDEGTAFYLRALQLEVAERPDDVEARRFLAEALTEQGRLDEARRQFEAAIAIRPQDVDARFGLAKVFIAQRDLAAARDQLQQLLSTDPDHREARELLKFLDGKAE